MKLDLQLEAFSISGVARVPGLKSNLNLILNESPLHQTCRNHSGGHADGPQTREMLSTKQTDGVNM